MQAAAVAECGWPTSPPTHTLPATPLQQPFRAKPPPKTIHEEKFKFMQVRGCPTPTLILF